MSAVSLNVTSFLPNGDRVDFKKQATQIVADVFSNTLLPVCYPVDPSYATISMIPQELQASPKKAVRWLTENQYVPVLKEGSVYFVPLVDPDFEAIKKCYANLVSNSNKISIYEFLELQDRITNSNCSVRNTHDYSEMVEGIEALVIGLFTESFEADCSIQKNAALFNPNHTFVHDGQGYVIKFTRGNGSCALHALLGQETSGVYRFPGNDCDVEAKKYFTNALKEALEKCDEGVITHFISIMMDYWSDASKENSTFEARLLFATTPAGHNFSKQLRELQTGCQQQIEAIQVKKAVCWLSLAEGSKEIADRLMAEVKADQERQAGPYIGKTREEIWQVLSVSPIKILNIIETKVDDFLDLLKQDDRANMDQLESALVAIRDKRNTGEQSLIRSEAVIKHYVDAVTKPEFFLNTHEIKLAAQLFNKNVLIFASQPIELSETVDEGAASEPIAIYHHGAHFSRCIKAQEVGVENEPSVPERKGVSWIEPTLPQSRSFEGGLSTLFAPSSALMAQNPDALQEDAHPFGTFFLQEGRVIKVDGTSNVIEVQIKKEDAERLYLQSCDVFAGDPALLYQMAQKLSIPKAHSIRFQSQALDQLINSATEEYQKAFDQSDFEKSSQIFERQESLNQKKVDLTKDQKELMKLWNLNKRKYFEKAFYLSIYSGDKIQQREFFDLFDTLRKLNPHALIPFHPLLTTLASRLEKATLKHFMEEAKECDHHLTYALVVGFARIACTYNELDMFQGYRADAVLEVLQELYPQDLVLPAFLVGLKSESGAAPLDLSPVSENLAIALHTLASGEIRPSILQIVKTTPLLCGYAILHRYLAVAWSCSGDFAQAEKMVKRASQLPDIHTQNCSHSVEQIIINTFKAMMPNDAAMPKENLEASEDPLADFVKMSQTKPLNIALATQFVKRATSSLKSDMQQMPLVYFGIQNLASRLHVGPHENFSETYRPLFDALFECISVLLDICYNMGDLDPWIKEISEKKAGKNSYSFVLAFPSIKFGLSSIHKKEIPLFKFLDNLALTSQSVRSLATCTTREVYGLIVGLTTSHVMPALNFEHTPLPDDSLIFIGILQSGLKGAAKGALEPAFQSSAAHLKKYLDLRPADRPYQIDHEILEWAKFCVFTLNSAIDLPENSCYPENFSISSAKDIFQNVKKKLIASEKTDVLVQNAMRDVFLANHYLKTRSIHETIALIETNNLYTLYKIAQRLYGWHYQESFIEWGARLKNAEISGPGASDFNQMEHMAVDVFSQSGDPTIEGHLNAKERKALRELLQFWLEFYKTTCEKNAFILSGGDEDSAAETKDWLKDIELKTWQCIVEKNAPQSYPNFKILSEREKGMLSEIVKNKHAHYLEVLALKKLCAKPGHLLPEVFVMNMATTLLINAEFERSGAYHSVFMENEAQARSLYQLLLEVSAERIVRNALVIAGMQGWVDFNRHGDILLTALHPLIGAFHGPEAHFSGNGPIQQHYNAGIVTSKLRSQNIHIYFNE